MVRVVRHVGSNRQSQTTSPSVAANWDPFVDTRGSPSSSNGGVQGTTSGGSEQMPHSSSQGEGSPSEGNASQTVGGMEGIGSWPEALLQPVTDDNGEHRLPIEFNESGQTIGPTRSTYGTKVAKIARNLVSPHYPNWKVVPCVLKDEIWRCIKNSYAVSDVYKPKALIQANFAWKKSKASLRLICDSCSTVAEMKSKQPQYIRKEDWDEFVGMVSKEEDWIIRAKGKLARSKLKALHSTGRGGIASRRDKMEKESPTGLVTRSALFLATHVYQEIPEADLMHFEPESYEVRSRNFVRQVRELNETEKYRNETNLDRDAVAEVFGVDRRGVVRGMGGGVSKTELRASAVSREQLRQEKMKSAAIENRLCSLEDQFTELRAGLTRNPSTSNANSSHSMNVGRQGVEHVVLRNMRNSAVTFGRIDHSIPAPNAYSHLVLIDEVLMGNEVLIDRDGNLADIHVGEKIQWPMHSVTSLQSS